MRIDGDAVVWVQGPFSGTTVYYFDLAWLGPGASAKVLAGPEPGLADIAIGDQYIAWTQPIAFGGRGIHAIARSAPELLDPNPPPPLSISVASDPDWDESLPATHGDWIVWQAEHVQTGSFELRAVNLRTGARRTISHVGALVSRPSIDGDLISYESNSDLNFNIYVYRISDAASFQVTTDLPDQFLNNVHGDLVAYNDNRNGNLDVFLSKLDFVPPDPPGTVLSDAAILVLVIDTDKVRSEIKYEDPERIYPHIYGLLNRDAIVSSMTVKRADDGTFLALEG